MFSGVTAITGGTLQLGNGGTVGSLDFNQRRGQQQRIGLQSGRHGHEPQRRHKRRGKRRNWARERHPLRQQRLLRRDDDQRRHAAVGQQLCPRRVVRQPERRRQVLDLHGFSPDPGGLLGREPSTTWLLRREL